MVLGTIICFAPLNATGQNELVVVVNSAFLVSFHVCYNNFSVAYSNLACLSACTYLAGAGGGERESMKKRRFVPPSWHLLVLDNQKLQIISFTSFKREGKDNTFTFRACWCNEVDETKSELAMPCISVAIYCMNYFVMTFTPPQISVYILWAQPADSVTHQEGIV